ncbi:28S ribosomal protein S11, mitochondrial [Esox lucius]|uniref:Small ribosomal subunit protein uS11m n=1 Tax=Esox lucius TaxID=8010 RepID=C1BW94_ESOLU|nr:28S ribosomal protein S11, mitochondrial [Esox lucius]ACO13297.1 28S ribosomal protein S11, mitochondrial precursor [Esox lucius]
MYKLNCILSNSVRKACQQVATSLSVEGSICGVASPQRTVCISAVRLQDPAGPPPTQTENCSKEFSFLPPMPGQDSPLRWGGKKYDELPIAHIKATYNNTHIQVTDNEGKYMVRTSCGTEGFRNVKKSTPVAAQTAGIAAATKATVAGVTFVRVLVKGLGPGRLSAIKGLTMGGLEVVSITDNTPVPHNGCRPRKARRI